MRVPLTVADHLARAERVHPHRIGIIDEHDQPSSTLGRITYAEVAELARAQAAALDRAGLEVGDRVAVLSHNAARLLISFFGVCGYGRVLVPINFRLNAEEVRYIVEHSGAGMLLVDPDLRDVVADLDVDTLVFGTDDARIFATGEQPRPWAAPDEDATATINYTSGTTARPKGVQLTHRTLWLNAAMLGWHVGVSDRDTYLHTLPLFHVNAIMVSVLSPMSVGARTRVTGAFAPEPFLDLLERERPTYFSGVPTIYARLASLPREVIPDTSSLRFAICGAAPVTADLLRRCEERFGFVMVEGYGLTEGTCASACNPIRGTRKIGTVGPVIDGQQLRVVDEHGDDVPVGAVGEVVIAGPTVMRGYLNRPEATAETIRDGWLRTGDVGRLDEDGYLQIVDRIKDMIIRGGENIYPKEIEETIGDLDAVLEVAVVGRPHEDLGEVPVAFVTRYPDTALSEADVLEHCRANLTRVKVPVEVDIVDALPKNPVGKIDKPTLRRSLEPSSA